MLLSDSGEAGGIVPPDSQIPKPHTLPTQNKKLADVFYSVCLPVQRVKILWSLNEG